MTVVTEGNEEDALVQGWRSEAGS